MLSWPHPIRMYPANTGRGRAHIDSYGCDTVSLAEPYMTNLSTFIAEYTEAEHSRIAFSWNGKYSSEFEDANQDFRWKVVQECLAAPSTASPLLLKHLFTADAQWSKEAWCAPRHFAGLAAALLTEGQEPMLVAFANGLVTSFDTFGACHEMQLPASLVARLSLAAQQELADTSQKEERKPMEVVAELLRKLQQGTATQGWVQVAPGTPVSNVRVVWPRWYHRLGSRLVCLLRLRNTTNPSPEQTPPKSR